MNTNHNKLTVLSWLLFSAAGVIATYLSMSADVFQPVFAISPFIAAVMLSWIKNNKTFYNRLFYLYSWYLSLLFLLIIILSLAYWFQFGGKIR